MNHFEKVVHGLLWLLVVVASPNVVQALCNTGVKAPGDVPMAASEIATERKSATITVGPGGPIYVRVRNNGEIGVSFGVTIRKTADVLLKSHCSSAGVLSAGEEYWLEAKYAGDELVRRDVDVFTGVQGASLELSVFKYPNLLPATVSDIVTIWLRAFIPNHNTGPANYVRLVPGRTDAWMIPGPQPAVIPPALRRLDGVKVLFDCFMTDNRGFSSDRTDSFRVGTEFRIVIYYGQVSVQPVHPAQVHRAGVSSRIDCNTGQVIERKVGTFSPPFGIQALGTPTIADGKIQILGQAAAGNPHFLQAPYIDYSFDLTYDTEAKTIFYAFTSGYFPAFEAYAMRDNKIFTLLQLEPQSETAGGLMEGGTGLRTVQTTGKVHLAK